MSRGLKTVIDGIEYPREIPCPEGLPPGWICVEQCYGPTSKSAGQTYTRFSLKDKRPGCSSLAGPKQVWQKHCEKLGIPWEPEYAHYEECMRKRRENEEAERRAERESRGQCEGPKREEMIALSEAKFGAITGKIALGFPGWKCRWEFSPSSGQVCKTFVDQDGREWKLLKDVECLFGVRLTEGGKGAEIITKMVEHGQANFAAHALFSGASVKAREAGGVYWIDPANPNEEKFETLEERDCRRKDRSDAKRQKKEAGRLQFVKNSLHEFSDSVFPVQSGWASLANAADWQKASVEFKSLLSKRKFSDKEVELVAVRDVDNASKFADRVSGIYYGLLEPLCGRKCYQKLLSVQGAAASGGVCCDGVFLIWSAAEARWQICTQASEEACCIAYCQDEQADVLKVTATWQVQQQGHGDFHEDSSLKVTSAKQ